VRDLIEQVLLTAPGERVMRPDFGAGLLALVFEPNSTVLAATTQMLVQSALQLHLSHLIAVEAVEVLNDDAALRVEVRYALLGDRTTHSATFALPGAAP
jgi:phage baseplate assembly protein W